MGRTYTSVRNTNKRQKSTQPSLIDLQGIVVVVVFGGFFDVLVEDAIR
jgi:hypothetical protein